MKFVTLRIGFLASTNDESMGRSISNATSSIHDPRVLSYECQYSDMFAVLILPMVATGEGSEEGKRENCIQSEMTYWPEHLKSHFEDKSVSSAVMTGAHWFDGSCVLVM